jgi:hypothetical protein
LYIHACELGPTPAKAAAAADTLRTRMPDQGHLVHMPSHIDMWLGRYLAAVETNVRAVAADDKHLAAIGPRINQYLGYRLHNMHFVVWGAMFHGNLPLAREYAARIEAECDTEVCLRSHFCRNQCMYVFSIYNIFNIKNPRTLTRR